MFKRYFLFFVVNILVVMTISIIISLTGLGAYLNQSGAGYTGLFIFCLIWGIGGSFISLLISKWMAKWAYGVQIVDNEPQYRDLVQKVHFLSKKAGLNKMPEVGIFESPEINAFATGYSKNNSLVAVSTGLLQNMNEAETEGVIGHEIAHIANGDMVTMGLVQGIVNAFVMFFARIITFAIDNFLRDEEGEGGLGFFAHIIVVNVLQMIFSILAAPIVMWFSRWREFRADSGGAKLAGRHKMILALEKLQQNYENLSSHEGNLQTMSISSKSSWTELFSSHPPLDKRIEALKKGL